MRFFLLLTTAFAMALGVNADPIFAGCGTLGVLGNVLSGVLGTVSNLLATLFTGDDCQVQCKNLGYQYSLFSLGLSSTLLTYDKNTLLGSCWCNNDGLKPSSVYEGADDQGTCKTFLVGLIGVKVDYVANNQLSFEGCKSEVTFTPNTDAVQFNVDTEDQCFMSPQCANKQNIAVRSNGVKEEANILGGLLDLLLGTTGGSYQCMCSNGAIGGASGICESRTAHEYVPGGILGLGAYYLNTYAWNTYFQDVPTVALGARDLRQARNAENLYCPKDLTACSIPGTEEYECIDTTSDLESCGGCVSGQFGANGTEGIDCTSLPNVALGGVSCVKGECVISKCQRGHKLRAGSCW